MSSPITGQRKTYLETQNESLQNIRSTDPQSSVGDQEGNYIISDTGKTVFGVGTEQPYSRISMGNYSSLENSKFNIPALAFNEESTGNFASGISFSTSGDISRMSFSVLSNKIESEFSSVNNDVASETNLEQLIDFNLDKPNHGGLPLMIMQAIGPTNENTNTNITPVIPTSNPNDNNNIQMKEGNNIYINCWPEQSGLLFGTRDRKDTQGLTLNGSLNLTNRINFVSSSLVERNSIDNNAFIQNNDGQILLENDITPENTINTAKSLYHVTDQGTRYHELLTRAGLNRVVDISSSLISIFPNCYTNGYTVTNSGVTTSYPGVDPSGIFLFRNSDFVIGHGEMVVSQQLTGSDEANVDASEHSFWSNYTNSSTSFINCRGNTAFCSITDISNQTIISKAYDNTNENSVDPLSRYGVLYLQNNLTIGKYQPEAIIDISKIDLPFLKIGKNLITSPEDADYDSTQCKNSILIGNNINASGLKYSLIFTNANNISNLEMDGSHNFIFGYKQTLSNQSNKLNYNLAFGYDNEIQGEHNFIFGKDCQITEDISHCTLFGFGTIINDTSYNAVQSINNDDNNTAVMKYSFPDSSAADGSTDIFVLTKNGSLHIPNDLFCKDFSCNLIAVNKLGTWDRHIKESYINHMVGKTLNLLDDASIKPPYDALPRPKTGDILCIDICSNDISCNIIQIDEEITAPKGEIDELYVVGNKGILMDNNMTINKTLNDNDISTLHLISTGHIELRHSNNEESKEETHDSTYINSIGNIAIGYNNTLNPSQSRRFSIIDINNNDNIKTFHNGVEIGKDISNNYHLNLASSNDSQINFGISGEEIHLRSQIIYNSNREFNIIFDDTLYIKKQLNDTAIQVDGTKIDIYKSLNLIGDNPINVKEFAINDGGKIKLKDDNNLIQLDGTMFKNKYNNEYGIFNNNDLQMKFDSNNITISKATIIDDTLEVENTTKIKGDLIVNVSGREQNVGDLLGQTAAAGAITSSTNGLYVDTKFGINIRKGITVNDTRDFIQYLPKFELDISGNIRAKNIIMGESTLNILPFDFTDYSANIVNKTYENGSYDISYNSTIINVEFSEENNNVEPRISEKESTDETNNVWKMFDGNNNTFWSSFNNFVVDPSGFIIATNVISETIKQSSITETVELKYQLTEIIYNEENAKKGEMIEIELPQRWNLKYYGLKRSIGGNMPSKWYILGFNSQWIILDYKDISSDTSPFLDNDYYYYKVDANNSYPDSKDSYDKFAILVESIFKPDDAIEGDELSCEICGIQLFGEFSTVPDLSSNILQSQYQDYTMNTRETESTVNLDQTKSLSLQPYGGKVGISTVDPKVTLDISAVDAIIVPTGTTEERPTDNSEDLNEDYRGSVRFNISDNQFEGYDGNNWSGLGGVISLDQKTKIEAENEDGLIFKVKNPDKKIVTLTLAQEYVIYAEVGAEVMQGVGDNVVKGNLIKELSGTTNEIIISANNDDSFDTNNITINYNGGFVDGINVSSISADFSGFSEDFMNLKFNQSWGKPILDFADVILNIKGDNSSDFDTYIQNTNDHLVFRQNQNADQGSIILQAGQWGDWRGKILFGAEKFEIKKGEISYSGSSDNEPGKQSIFVFDASQGKLAINNYAVNEYNLYVNGNAKIDTTLLANDITCTNKLTTGTIETADISSNVIRNKHISIGEKYIGEPPDTQPKNGIISHVNNTETTNYALYITENITKINSGNGTYLGVSGENVIFIDASHNVAIGNSPGEGEHYQNGQWEAGWNGLNEEGEKNPITPCKLDISGATRTHSLIVKGDLSGNDASFNKVDINGDLNGTDCTFEKITIETIKPDGENPIGITGNLISTHDAKFNNIEIEGDIHFNGELKLNGRTNIKSPFSSISHQAFNVVVRSIDTDGDGINDSNVYIIDTIIRPILTLERGKTYIFHDPQEVLNSSHPLEFWEYENKTGEKYLTTYENNAVKFTVPSWPPVNQKIYYECGNHASMGSYINIVNTSLSDIYYNGGNVGIGMNNPQHTLDVSGNINFTGELKQGGEIFKSGAFEFNEADETKIYYNGGNVGIGIDDPSAKLHIKPSIANDGIKLMTSNGNTNTVCELISDSNGMGKLQLNDDSGQTQVSLVGNNASGNNFIMGNVGIGTNSPDSDSALDVKSSNVVTKIRIQHDNLALLQLHQITGDHKWNLEIGRSEGEFSIRGPTGPDIPEPEKVRIKANGNMGIGVEDPQRRLHVGGDILLNNGTWATGSIRKIIGDSTHAKKAIWWTHDNDLAGTQIRDENSIGLYTGGTTGENHVIRMKIDTAGNANFYHNVGIGSNSSPSYALDVSGDIHFTGRLMKTDENGTAEFEGGGGGAFTVDGTKAYFNETNGRVGIRTTTPECALDVNGDIKIRAADSSETERGIHFRAGAPYNSEGVSPYNCSILTYAHDNNWSDGLSINGYDGVSICTGSNNRQERMRINKDGNVGIGKTNPNYTLDVNGEIHASSNIIAYSSSDRRLKNNIKPIDNPLDKLKKINGYTFEWVKNKEIHSFEGNDIGVIAQEIEEVLPEVTTTRENGYKAVRYEKMVPFLISCIKEQQKQIDELRELLKK